MCHRRSTSGDACKQSFCRRKVKLFRKINSAVRRKNGHCDWPGDIRHDGCAGMHPMQLVFRVT